MAVASAKRTIVVGIDFGTHGSGFMYTSYTSAGFIRECVRYPDQPFAGPKTLTALLYKDDQPVSWGWTARQQFLELSPRDRLQHEYVYVAEFKLALTEASGRSPLPAGLDCVQVAADYLRFLAQYILKELHTAYGTGFHPDLVQWCITIPANWDEGTKNKMRQAVHRAGIIRVPNSDALVIVYEPEAAALSVNTHKDGEVDREPTITVGDSFLVVDAGGGTVDVTSHKAITRGGAVVLSETSYCRGAFAGSTYVDARWREYYRQRVGERAFDMWVQDHPAEVVHVETEWESIKQSFAGISADNHRPKHVPVPESLLDIMAESDKAMLKAHENGYDDRISLLQGRCWANLFDPVIDDIVHLVTEQLEAVLRAGHRCDKLLLVGGFAESAYLASRIQITISNLPSTKIVVPLHPQKAVVQGAVLYGSTPELFHARRSRLTYGVRHCCVYTPGAPNKLWNDEEGYFYTSRGFTAFVARDQEVQVDERVQHEFIPLYNNQPAAEVRLYATESTNIKFFPAKSTCDLRKDAAAQATRRDVVMQSVGTLRVTLPPMVDKHQHIIDVSTCFGRTEISAVAVDRLTGRECDASITFAASKPTNNS